MTIPPLIDGGLMLSYRCTSACRHCLYRCSPTQPVFSTLCHGGPVQLMEALGAPAGFAPRDDGYISKCDLCFDVRRHLARQGGYDELRPTYFYA